MQITVGGQDVDLASVAMVALLLVINVWGLGVALPLALWDRRRLRSDVHAWLRRRDIECPDDVTPHALKVRGGVAIGGRNDISRRGLARDMFTVVVVTPAFVVIETQWPLWVWRRRLVIHPGAVFRNIDGRIADPKRRCLVASTPPEQLHHLLRISAWEIKDVPF